jgi:nitroimidazol reductase NimA-like FMN-containing flavoprotein (pyridoxamine 5'-phosphate oxidase superfamily)
MREEEKFLPARPERGSADVPGKLRALDSSQLHAVLCTVGEDSPYASLVAYALTPGLEGVVFATPKDSRKYRNILENRNVCLLIDTRSNTGFDYLGAEAITIEGTARQIRKGKRRKELSQILTRKHPRLSDFVSADGTAIVFVEIERCVHVTQFQKVTEWHR